MTVDQVLDRKELFHRIDEDFELLQELIELFLEDYPSLMTEIGESLTMMDADRMKKAAHTLKGAVGNFCAQAAFDAAFVLETSAANDDLSNGTQQFARLQAEMEKVTMALGNLQDECASAC